MEISVCLIVKNEEKVLARCLACVQQFADEIVVVDTGSTDQTKSIAKKYTKNVFDFEWTNDFASARNFSFSKATKDYVMWLDADDVVLPKEIEKLRILKKSMFADTYMLKYAVAFDKNGEPTFCYFRERILKRSCNPKWQGFVHEVVVPFGKIEYLDITICHQKMGNPNPQRNLKIYQKHKKNGEKFSAREQYYFAKELFYNGKVKQCVVELKKFLKMPQKFEPNVVDAFLTIAKCYQLLKKNSFALKVLFECLQTHVPTSEILCEIGNIFVEEQSFEKAILFFEMATLVEPDYESGQFVDKNFYHFYPHMQLTMLYYKIGDYEKSKHFHNLCKDEQPNDPLVKHNQQFFGK